MRAKIVTTVTTYIDLDTFTPSHEVDINTEDDLPRAVVIAAVKGGLSATLRRLEPPTPAASPAPDPVGERGGK